MRIYNQVVWSEERGCLNHWETSKARALRNARCTILNDPDEGTHLGTLHVFEIKPTAEGIVRFLNAHAETGNG